MGSGKKAGKSRDLASVSFEWKPVLTLASGDSFHIPVYTFAGTEPQAPTAYLQSAMHGPEVQGSLVIALLHEYLKENPPLGTIRLVPNCNPVGLNNKRGDYTDGRFDPVTGDNFNRKYHLPTKNFPWDEFLKNHGACSERELRDSFRSEMRKSLEAARAKGGVIAERLATQVQLLSLDFDHCLDLHCANASVRHVYAPESTKPDVAYFGIPNVVLIPDEEFGGAKDEVFIHPWAELARRRGDKKILVQSFTLELGPQETIDRKNAEKDLKGILSYLAHRGVIRGRAVKSKPLYCALKHYTTVAAPQGGLGEWHAAPGDSVKAGQLLARILTFGEQPTYLNVKAPVSGVITVRHSSSIMHEGAELMKIVQRKAQ
jgi:predicted deacylase